MIIWSLIATTETTDTSHSVYGAQDWRTQYIPTYEAWRTKYHKETYNSRRHSRKSFSAWVTNFIEVQTVLILSRRVFLLGKNARLLQWPFVSFRPQNSHWSVHFLEKLLKPLRPSPAKANLVQTVPLYFFYFFNVTFKTGRD